MSAEKYSKLFTSFLSPEATDARKAQSIGNETVLMFLRTADSLLVSDSSHRFSCSALLNSADMMTIRLPGSRGRGRRTLADSAPHWGAANRTTTTGRRSRRGGNGASSTPRRVRQPLRPRRGDEIGTAAAFSRPTCHTFRAQCLPRVMEHEGSAAGSAFSRDDGKTIAASSSSVNIGSHRPGVADTG